MIAGLHSAPVIYWPLIPLAREPLTSVLAFAIYYISTIMIHMFLKFVQEEFACLYIAVYITYGPIYNLHFSVQQLL